MPDEIRYVQEDNCSDALAMAHNIAIQGDPGGQYSMGFLWSRGCGVPRSYRNAYNWYVLSAHGGDARAMVKLGDMHRLGMSVEQDAQKASEWYTLAARWGSGEARNMLILMNREVPYPDLIQQEKNNSSNWLTEFASTLLIGAAIYYGALSSDGASLPQPTVRNQPMVARSPFQTNCFVSTLGSYVNVNCYSN